MARRVASAEEAVQKYGQHLATPAAQGEGQHQQGQDDHSQHEATVEDGKLVVKVTPAKTGSRFYRLVNP